MCPPPPFTCGAGVTVQIHPSVRRSGCAHRPTASHGNTALVLPGTLSDVVCCVAERVQLCFIIGTVQHKLFPFIRVYRLVDLANGFNLFVVTRCKCNAHEYLNCESSIVPIRKTPPAIYRKDMHIEKPRFPSCFTREKAGQNAYRSWQAIAFPCLRVFDNIFRTFGLNFQSLKGSKTLDFPDYFSSAKYLMVRTI